MCAGKGEGVRGSHYLRGGGGSRKGHSIGKRSKVGNTRKAKSQLTIYANLPEAFKAAIVNPSFYPFGVTTLYDRH